MSDDTAFQRNVLSKLDDLIDYARRSRDDIDTIRSKLITIEAKLVGLSEKSGSIRSDISEVAFEVKQLTEDLNSKLEGI